MADKKTGRGGGHSVPPQLPLKSEADAVSKGSAFRLIKTRRSKWLVLNASVKDTSLTVSRLMPSSRAMRRLDQPLPDKVKIECCRFTLSLFIAPKSSPDCPNCNAPLKVAGFHSTLTGWF
jgi:hypothetical protein